MILHRTRSGREAKAPVKRTVSVSQDLVAMFVPYHCLSMVVAEPRGTAVAAKVLLAAFHQL